MSKILLVCIFYLAFVSAALRKRQVSTTVQTQIALDTPDTLYTQLTQYRLTQGNLYQTLATTEYNGDQTENKLHGKASIEVEYLLKNMDAFGQHINFERNSEGFTQYCEVIAKILHETSNPYQYAFDLWKQDPEIQKDFLNEYTAADTDCHYGWVCVLMLAYQ